jgi:hypothetical protein
VIQNPVLRGFEPDRVILRVGDDHYIDGGAERDAEEWIGLVAPAIGRRRSRVPLPLDGRADEGRGDDALEFEGAGGAQAGDDIGTTSWRFDGGVACRHTVGTLRSEAQVVGHHSSGRGSARAHHGCGAVLTPEPTPSILNSLFRTCS